MKDARWAFVVTFVVTLGVAGCGATAAGGQSPRALASGEVQPYDLAVNATHLYWTTTFVPPPGHGKLMRVALAGGAPEELIAGRAGDNPHSIVLDETSVYWTDFTATTGAILKMSLAGGEPVVVAANQDDPHGLAVDATSVTWTTFASPGQVRRASKNPIPGTPAAVVDLAAAESLRNNVTVDETFAYWTDYLALVGTVPRARLDGTTAPETIAANQDHPYGIAVDAHDVYWTNVDGGQLMKRSLSGGEPVVVATDPKPWRVMVAGGQLVWASYPQMPASLPTSVGAVRRVSVEGGLPTTLAPATSFHVAVGPGVVYWTSYRDGAGAGVAVTGGSVFALTLP